MTRTEWRVQNPMRIHSSAKWAREMEQKIRERDLEELRRERARQERIRGTT